MAAPSAARASAPRRPPASRAHTPRQEELLDVALALTREVGLAGLTVRKLAAVIRDRVSPILALEGLPVLILAEAAAAGDEALLARFRTVVGELRAIYGGLLAEAGAPPVPSAEALGVVLIGIGAATALQYRLAASRTLHREVRAHLPAFVVERLLGPEPATQKRPRTPPEPPRTESRIARKRLAARRS